MNPLASISDIAAAILREFVGELTESVVPALAGYLQEVITGWLEGEEVSVETIRADKARVLAGSAALQGKVRPAGGGAG